MNSFVGSPLIEYFGQRLSVVTVGDAVWRWRAAVHVPCSPQAVWADLFRLQNPGGPVRQKNIHCWDVAEKTCRTIEELQGKWTGSYDIYVFLCVLLQTGCVTSSWEQGYPRPGPASLGLDPVPGRGGLHTLFQPVERCQVLREGTDSGHKTTAVLSTSKKKKWEPESFCANCVCSCVSEPFCRVGQEMWWSWICLLKVCSMVQWNWAKRCNTFFFSSSFPFHPLALCVYSGGVHHCYHALRGPLCFADPRHNSAGVHGRHQGLPPHRLQAAQQSRGQGRCTSVSTHPWVLERFRMGSLCDN